MDKDRPLTGGELRMIAEIGKYKKKRRYKVEGIRQAGGTTQWL